MHRIVRFVVAMAVLVSALNAVADDQEKANKEITKVRAMAVDVASAQIR